MEEIPVSVRLATSGTLSQVNLSRQLHHVQAIYLDEALAVGWNGGVASGAFLRLEHNQLNDINIADRPARGAMLLVSPLVPHMVYSNKLLFRGEIGTLQGFQISIVDINGTPVTFTELYLVFKVVCRNNDARNLVQNAMRDIPQIKGPDPAQTRFFQ
jgi:hypothetical protein